MTSDIVKVDKTIMQNIAIILQILRKMTVNYLIRRIIAGKTESRW